MKVTQVWKRNIPTTVCGESVSVTVTYHSFDKNEVDVLEALMPRGMLTSEIDGKQIVEWFVNLKDLKKRLSEEKDYQSKEGTNNV